MTPDRGRARYGVHLDELAFAEDYATPRPQDATSPAPPARGSSPTVPASSSSGAVAPSTEKAPACPTASRPIFQARAGAGG
jgi:hypothetical protein